MADVNDKECCNSCRFFSKDSSLGACRRYPTLVNKGVNDWCGEFVLSEESPTIEQIVKMMAEPVILSEPKKQRGRPKKC